MLVSGVAWVRVGLTFQFVVAGSGVHQQRGRIALGSARHAAVRPGGPRLHDHRRLLSLPRSLPPPPRNPPPALLFAGGCCRALDVRRESRGRPVHPPLRGLQSLAVLNAFVQRPAHSDLTDIQHISENILVSVTFPVQSHLSSPKRPHAPQPLRVWGFPGNRQTPVGLPQNSNPRSNPPGLW